MRHRSHHSRHNPYTVRASSWDKRLRAPCKSPDWPKCRMAAATVWCVSKGPVLASARIAIPRSPAPTALTQALSENGPAIWGQIRRFEGKGKGRRKNANKRDVPWQPKMGRDSNAICHAVFDAVLLKPLSEAGAAWKLQPHGRGGDAARHAPPSLLFWCRNHVPYPTTSVW